MTRHLHISIGPVQTFVMQARRTRDLWAGSYLLSFLTAHAMKGAQQAGGKVVRPVVRNDPMLAAVESRAPSSASPSAIGSLPNQFSVEVRDGLAVDEIAKAAEEAFAAAWRYACRAVWDRFVEAPAKHGSATRAIWDRQTEGFWELVWIATDPQDRGGLARRKRWRTHWLPEEPGDKCTLMPDFQELSGFERAHNKAEQERFWSVVRNRIDALDCDEKERLCSIALVKRLFPRITRESLGWELDVTRWPSTLDVAAADWVDRSLALDAKAANDYAQRVFAADSNTRRGGAYALIGRRCPMAELDANWLHSSFVWNRNNLSDAVLREQLTKALKALQNLPADGAQLGPAPVYYALLLADGDRLGELLGRIGAEPVSEALAHFTSEVPDIVRSANGVAIYAGGDDVLALLPLSRALESAQRLERAYVEGFEADAKASLSAAVVFAHARAPLTRVLAEAHHLLDDVAKEQNGRSSLAVGVYRPGGLAIQWCSTWRRYDDQRPRDAVALVKSVADLIKNETLSKSVVQGLRALLARLSADPRPSPGSFAEWSLEGSLEPVVRSEVEHSLDRRERKLENADSIASVVTCLLRRAQRNEDSTFVGIDGLLLAAFLANGGVEADHGP